MAEKFTNSLINESSPYLQQHAHNPVNWYPWGEEALAKARTEDKPILVSIGYAACHWCHVMEKESFEDEDTAAIMNESFINIKIDREERPDLDHIYMDAVQAMAGNGGWPLNVFLTCDAKPFYGGTYFPPKPAYSRPSWKDVLVAIADAWKNRRQELESQADNLIEHISSSAKAMSKAAGSAVVFSRETCDNMAAAILKNADTKYGGFGAAPKFPQTFTLQYLLAYSYFFNDKASLDQAILSINNMLDGGIYDQLAGGLARYSTDSYWLVPHFEKMLYDNALLVIVLSDAFQLTRDKKFEEAIRKTLAFCINEMKHPSGGFYAALDADSEGEEGRFYVWEKAEIEQVLGKNAELYCSWYSVTDEGNWEEKNILHKTFSEADFAAKQNIEVDVFRAIIAESDAKLLQVRSKRSRPQTDDKILLGWNALLLTAFCKAYPALGDTYYKQEAEELYKFLIGRFSKNGIISFHTYKQGDAKFPAFLDDYAWFIQACIHLQEITSCQDYLLEAQKLTHHVISLFYDEGSGFFYFTGNDQKDIVARKVELYDGAVPSGNSTTADNLLYLSVIFENSNWKEMALKMLSGMEQISTKYPTSFAVWASIYLKQFAGVNEVVVTGKEVNGLAKALLALYLPNRIFQSAIAETPGFPLLQGKSFGADGSIYLCAGQVCYEPVNTVDKFQMLLKKPLC